MTPVGSEVKADVPACVRKPIFNLKFKESAKIRTPKIPGRGDIWSSGSRREHAGRLTIA